MQKHQQLQEEPIVQDGWAEPHRARSDALFSSLSHNVIKSSSLEATKV